MCRNFSKKLIFVQHRASHTWNHFKAHIPRELQSTFKKFRFFWLLFPEGIAECLIGYYIFLLKFLNVVFVFWNNINKCFIRVHLIFFHRKCNDNVINGHTAKFHIIWSVLMRDRLIILRNTAKGDFSLPIS